MPGMSDVRSSAVDVALEEWERVVRDPQDRDRIKTYIREGGADWMLDGGRYVESENFWCGMFAAYCFQQVGEHLVDGQCVDLTLADGLGRQIFPSTARLVGRGPYPWTDFVEGPPARISPEDIQRGDILLVKTGRTDRPYGGHVVLAEGPPEDGKIPTVEGNSSHGRLGNGEPGEGVCRAHWSAEDVGMALRLKARHFEGNYLSKLN
ncbi:MAG: hypothetical protein ABEN55_02710 [Bradymonadaceae bacterium]